MTVDAETQEVLLEALNGLEDEGNTYTKIILEEILLHTGMLSLREIQTTWRD